VQVEQFDRLRADPLGQRIVGGVHLRGSLCFIGIGQ
jgi:hypothetical protein